MSTLSKDESAASAVAVAVAETETELMPPLAPT